MPGHLDSVPLFNDAVATVVIPGLDSDLSLDECHLLDSSREKIFLGEQLCVFVIIRPKTFVESAGDLGFTHPAATPVVPLGTDEGQDNPQKGEGPSVSSETAAEGGGGDGKGQSTVRVLQFKEDRSFVDLGEEKEGGVTSPGEGSRESFLASSVNISAWANRFLRLRMQIDVVDKDARATALSAHFYDSKVHLLPLPAPPSHATSTSTTTGEDTEEGGGGYEGISPSSPRSPVGRAEEAQDKNNELRSRTARQSSRTHKRHTGPPWMRTSRYLVLDSAGGGAVRRFEATLSSPGPGGGGAGGGGDQEQRERDRGEKEKKDKERIRPKETVIFVAELPITVPSRYLNRPLWLEVRLSLGHPRSQEGGNLRLRGTQAVQSIRSPVADPQQQKENEKEPEGEADQRRLSGARAAVRSSPLGSLLMKGDTTAALLATGSLSPASGGGTGAVGEGEGGGRSAACGSAVGLDDVQRAIDEILRKTRTGKYGDRVPEEGEYKRHPLPSYPAVMSSVHQTATPGSSLFKIRTGTGGAGGRTAAASLPRDDQSPVGRAWSSSGDAGGSGRCLDLLSSVDPSFCDHRGAWDLIALCSCSEVVRNLTSAATGMEDYRMKFLQLPLTVSPALNLFVECKRGEAAMRALSRLQERELGGEERERSSAVGSREAEREREVMLVKMPPCSGADEEATERAWLDLRFDNKADGYKIVIEDLELRSPHAAMLTPPPPSFPPPPLPLCLGPRRGISLLFPVVLNKHQFPCVIDGDNAMRVTPTVLVGGVKQSEDRGDFRERGVGVKEKEDLVQVAFAFCVKWRFDTPPSARLPAIYQQFIAKGGLPRKGALAVDLQVPPGPYIEAAPIPVKITVANVSSLLEPLQLEVSFYKTSSPLQQGTDGTDGGTEGSEGMVGSAQSSPTATPAGGPLPPNLPEGYSHPPLPPAQRTARRATTVAAPPRRPSPSPPPSPPAKAGGASTSRKPASFSRLEPLTQTLSLGSLSQQSSVSFEVIFKATTPGINHLPEMTLVDRKTRGTFFCNLPDFCRINVFKAPVAQQQQAQSNG